MKVKELIKPLIIKKINFILFPLLAVIFVWIGTLIYQWRSEQAIRLGKMQARITSLNVLSFAKNEMSNYIDACISYNNMIEMHKEIETVKQTEYLEELTRYVLLTNPDAFALRCVFNKKTDNSTVKMEVIKDSLDNSIAENIDRQFYKLGLLELKQLSKTDNVTVTVPYKVQTTDNQGIIHTYTLLSFYKAIVDQYNNIIGQSCFDVQSGTVANLLQQLQALAAQNNCEAHLYLNDDKKFINYLEDKIELVDQKATVMPEELMTIINDGYDAEFDDRQAFQYSFIMPMRLQNFNSELSLVVSFPHEELIKSIGSFTAWLFGVMFVAYLLVAALLLYINRRLYEKYIEADIIVQKNYSTPTLTQGTL